MLGRVVLFEECGSAGVIECNACSGGEWAGALRYGFLAPGMGELKVGDMVTFFPARADDGSSWASRVCRVDQELQKHGTNAPGCHFIGANHHEGQYHWGRKHYIHQTNLWEFI